MRFINPFRKSDPAPAPESALLAQYRQLGELAVLGKLYAPYMELVFGICFKYLKSEDAAKDAVMQIFEKLVTDLQVHEVGNFKSWLHTVARNHCLMHLRSVRTFEDLDQVNAEAPEPAEAELALVSEGRLVALEHCMEQLGEEQRVSVSMFYLDQKCYREIADANGFEVNQVKSFIQNGKRNLKICMEANGRG